jgi:hypothetical protein
MNPILNLSAKALRRAVSVKVQIEKLQAQLDRILSADGATSSSKTGRKKRRLSAAARARISAAAKARWARVKAKKK